MINGNEWYNFDPMLKMTLQRRTKIHRSRSKWEVGIHKHFTGQAGREFWNRPYTAPRLLLDPKIDKFDFKQTSYTNIY